MSEKNEFDYGFSMEFKSESDYLEYSNHPLHLEFVSRRWVPEVIDFMEIDYVKHDLV